MTPAAASNGGICWNPLDEIRAGTENEVGDVQNLAALIVDPDGKGLASHWQRTAFALLVGVILHALYKAKHEGTPATLPTVDAMLADPARDIGELWMEMATASLQRKRRYSTRPPRQSGRKAPGQPAPGRFGSLSMVHSVS